MTGPNPLVVVHQSRRAAFSNDAEEYLHLMDACPSVIACNLSALSSAEQSQRGALSAFVMSAVERVDELPDGYALILPLESKLAMQAIEWALLELRCCPFLNFGLALRTGGAVLTLSGGPDVKEFLADTGLAKRAQGHKRVPSAGCGC
jgi:hypothetical protein